MKINTDLKPTDPQVVWTAFSLMTLGYGLVLAFLAGGGPGVGEALRAQWVIWVSPALLLTDYVAMVGIAPAFMNAGLVGLVALVTLGIAKQPVGSPEMGALGLIIGIGFFGKNPANMLPFIIGGWLYSLYKKEPYKNHVTVALFATSLGPMVSQPAHTPEIVAWLGPWSVLLGIGIGLFLGFVMNSMAVFNRRVHEGLNLYNVGRGAGLLALLVTMVYQAFGIGDVRDTTPGWSITGSYATGVLADPYLGMYGRAGDHYNQVMYLFLLLNLVFFMVFGLLGMRELDERLEIKELLYMKSYNNNFFNSHGPGYTYLAMAVLTAITLALTFPLGVHMNGAIYGAAISMIGWAGFGKAIANCVVIIGGVLLAALLRFWAVPGYGYADAAGTSMSFLTYYTTQSVILVSAFFGTCLSPMVRYFRWWRGIIVAMVHYFLVLGTADFHWGQHLYNNGFAAGLVCVVLIPIFRAFDRKGQFPAREM